MPIREDEEFCKHFLANTPEEAERLLKVYNQDLTMLASKFAMFTGLDAEDLKSEGTIGLARAKRDFEEGRSESFRIFAIYKIKDAMREFVTMQGENVRVPQYVKDALRLINNLREVLGKSYSVDYISFAQVWELSENVPEDNPTKADVDSIRNSLTNLANRSHTSVIQLLERAEVIPAIITTEFEYEEVNMNNVSDEDLLIEMISNAQIVEEIREILTKDEFNLLWNRFVEGMTIRELEEPLGIKPESIVVRTNIILKKLHAHFNRTQRNETNNAVKEVNSEHGC